MAEVEFTVDIDELTLDDLVAFDMRQMSQIVPILKRIVKIPGVPAEEMAARVGKLSWRVILDIANQINEVIQEEVNPVSAGKN